MQSFSKYKELPPIKAEKDMNDQYQRSINNKSTASNNSNNLPGFNLNTNQKSINKKFNPSVNETNFRRFQWDQELKQRSSEQRMLNTVN